MMGLEDDRFLSKGSFLAGATNASFREANCNYVIGKPGY